MTASSPVRAVVGMTALVLSAVVWFGPFLNEEQRPLVGYSLLMISILLDGSDRRESSGEYPAQIAWQDRDVGQKFSIIMFHLLIMALASVMAWGMATRIDAWYGPVLGALGMTAALGISWRNWKNRNAR